MLEEMLLIVESKGLFLVLFFSGVLFGVVAQRIVDNKPVKPFYKRLTIAGMTMSLSLSFNNWVSHLEAPALYPLSPLIGFFGEAIIETINEKRNGIGKGILELFLERLGFIKKGGRNEDKKGT